MKIDLHNLKRKVIAVDLIHNYCLKILQETAVHFAVENRLVIKHNQHNKQPQ